MMPDGAVTVSATSRSRRRTARGLVSVVHDDVGPLALVDFLGRGPAGETWVATLGDGATVAGTHVRATSAAEHLRILRNAEALRDVRSEELVPLVGTSPGTEANAVWLVSELDDGLPLRRLLSITEPTPDQALVVLLAVLDGLTTLEAAGWSHGALHANNVHVGLCGKVRLQHAVVTARRCTTASRRRDLDAVTALLRTIVDRGPRVAVGPSAARLLAARLAELSQPGVLSACTTIAGARRLALERVDGLAHDHVDDELAVLVGSVGGRAPQGMRRVVDAGRTATPGSPAASSWSYVPGRGRAALASLMAVGACAVLVGGLVVAFHARGSPATRPPEPAALSPATAPARATTPAPAAAPAIPLDPSHLSEVAPRSTAGVSGVGAPALIGPCPAGATMCVVTVRVVLAPQHGVELVTWRFHIVDRCTGAAVDESGGSVEALRQYQYVYDTNPITLPGSHPVAVVAVTVSPSAAASPPLLLGPTTC